MSGLGKITLSTRTNNSDSISFDESVCGMLFDLAYETGVFDNYPVIEHYFGNGQTILIHNLEEAEEYGLLDNDFLHGIPYYHISMYYKYIGGDAGLYLTFANCVDNNNQADFSVVQDIQLAASGRLFQLGVWTEQHLWERNSVDKLVFTGLLGELQSQVNILIGSEGNLSNESFPFNIVVTPCTASTRSGYDLDFNIDYQKLPDGTDLSFKNVSVVLGQEGSDHIHSIQQSITNLTPVGLLGFAMAALHLAPAELSIAYVGKFDLNRDDDVITPELGFGNNEFQKVNDGTPMSSFHRIRQNVLALKGYIIPVGYKAKEAGVFFSSDQTMSDGVYSSITNNRVINKCRRVIHSVVLPHVSNSLTINASTGKLSDVSAAIIQSDIINGIDRELVNKLSQSQISDRQVVVDTDNRILDDDKLSIKCTFIPVGTSDVINFVDDFNIGE